jgi:hypothetical protein
MDLDNRITEATQKFDQKQQERNDYLKLADECLEEMHKLQGEFRLLSALKENEAVTSEATTIKAVPAKEKK